MIQYLNVFFYDIYPYICATVFFLGSWLRYDYGQYTWRASSSQMLDKRVRATSTTPDIIIMSILLIQCLLGLSTIPFSAQYPDGSEMMKLVGWAQSIVTFRGGSSEMLSGVAFVFRVHLVLGMTIFLLFPFTRLVHVWSAPFEYFTRRYQIVRTRR
ncbi:TPA_asm: respiratory nitrate reductase subunit gamma [Salmonella enterica subsp. enterica serovar Abortusovis]|uniref:Respiratory nitrate reductase subunit gamma n=1 Tax=Salmonella enterica subsp. enterica serovar Abortusovis TaxID=53961 RepID=A0A738E347_SALET|nr:respiratory nitrate reductase subunit gamma [Salmonella enterica subsp. enterica serovar Abortusovis]HAE8720339.1 respiratory nitrate reductase subunit gamma [Salmonella enterica subsp. enterica serovar Abortusovis]